MSDPPLGDRFEQALIFAVKLHKNQKRKGTDIPYISHLLGVASIILEEGGDEDLVIAALLHDSIEDQGGKKTLKKILELFGNRVASIVRGCSDSDSFLKPPWRKRKEEYLQRLINENNDVVIVSLADKVHNSSSIKYDLKRKGESIWKRFTGGREGTLWYYTSLVEIFRVKSNSTLVEELAEIVSFMAKFKQRV